MDACQGDSGGPASLASADGRHTQVKRVKRINFKIFQVGIVSLGAGCGDTRFPALYTRMTKVHRHNMSIKLSNYQKMRSRVILGPYFYDRVQ